MESISRTVEKRGKLIRPPFAQFPKWAVRTIQKDCIERGKKSEIIKLVAMYTMLAFICSNQQNGRLGGWCIIGYPALARNLGISVSSVRRYTKKLKELNVVIITHRKSKYNNNQFFVNEYTLPKINPTPIQAIE